MSSWNNGKTRDDSLLSEFDQGHHLSPRPPIPENILDPDFTGYEDSDICCKHDMPMYKYVCFEGENTGRTFLGCGCKEEVMCDKVDWVDKEWPLPLKNALVKVWPMYEEEMDSRIHGNVEYATKNYQLVLKTRELENKNLDLHKQLGDTLEYVAEANTHELEYAKRQQAELQVASLKEDKNKLELEVAKRHKLEEQFGVPEEEKKKLECDLEDAKRQTTDVQVASLKAEKKKLEYYVADLLKHHHAYKDKMKKIADICQE